MKKECVLLAIIIIFFSKAELRAARYVPGELLVKYKIKADAENLNARLGKIGWSKVRVEKNKTMHQTMRNLTRNPQIIQVEPNYYGEFLSEPNDPYFDQQWYLLNIKAPEAWDTSLGEEVVIGLVDSGIDATHQDLAGNILSDGWDFGDDDDDPSDQNGHGTLVGGVIAGVQNNGFGISGVSPESKILPLKINQGGNNFFSSSAVAEALLYAADFGVIIINLSLEFKEKSQCVEDAVKYAHEKGCLIIAAAGNTNSPVSFPANLNEVMAIAAIGGSNLKSSFSNYGSEIELTAPGEFIFTTGLGGNFSLVDGTSFSAPIVTGVAALVAAKDSSLGREQLREHLIHTADDLGEEGRDEWYGYGKVNAFKAVNFYQCDITVEPPTLVRSHWLPLLGLLFITGTGDECNFVPGESVVNYSPSTALTSLFPLVISPNVIVDLALVNAQPDDTPTTVTVTVTTDLDTTGSDTIAINPLPFF